MTLTTSSITCARFAFAAHIQIDSGYEDGNDASTLYRDPLFKLAAEWASSLAAPALPKGVVGS